MATDDVLANLAWRAIRAWRRRRDVDPATRRAWVRLYVGVIRRGPYFTRDGDRWRCVERPELRMARDGTYHVGGHAQVFASIHDAAQHLTGPAASQDIS